MSKDWIDRNVEPWVQHTVIGLVGFALCSLWSVDLAVGVTVGANSARELTQAEAGEGFGWRTLIFPDAVFIIVWLIVRFIGG